VRGVDEPAVAAPVIGIGIGRVERGARRVAGVGRDGGPDERDPQRAHAEAVEARQRRVARGVADGGGPGVEVHRRVG
jgi:hypothetical protein